MYEHLWSELPGLLQLIILIAGAVGAVLALRKTVYLPLKRHFDRVNAGMDTLLGYPPVLDPGSGREIQAATPPLAARVYTLEETHKKMVNALEQIANNQHELLELRAQYDERKLLGDKVIEDFTKWRAWVDLQIRGWISEQDQLAKTVKNALEDETDA